MKFPFWKAPLWICWAVTSYSIHDDNESGKARYFNFVNACLSRSTFFSKCWRQFAKLIWNDFLHVWYLWNIWYFRIMLYFPRINFYGCLIKYSMKPKPKPICSHYWLSSQLLEPASKTLMTCLIYISLKSVILSMHIANITLLWKQANILYHLMIPINHEHNYRRCRGPSAT